MSGREQGTVVDMITDKCNAHTEKRRAQKQKVTNEFVIFQSALCKLLWQKVTEGLDQQWVRQLKKLGHERRETVGGGYEQSDEVKVFYMKLEKKKKS